MSQDNKELMSEKIYRAVSDMIAIHRFEPGLRINAEKLARELGVSRTPVWEAIRRLEQEGLLRNIPNRVMFMFKNSLKHAIEQIQVRTVLDRLAGRLACERVTARLLEQLSRCLRVQLAAIEEANAIAYSAADVRFHQHIYEAGGNAFLATLFRSINLHIGTVPSISSTQAILLGLPEVYAKHQEIVGGLVAKDPDRVEEATAQHGAIVIANLTEQLRLQRERKEMVRRIKKPIDTAKVQAKRRISRANPSSRPAESEVEIEAKEETGGES